MMTCSILCWNDKVHPTPAEQAHNRRFIRRQYGRLIRNRERVVSKEDIISAIWRRDYRRMVKKQSAVAPAFDAIN
jgi:hypothetical protein